jgi:hypothetical protein
MQYYSPLSNFYTNNMNEDDSARFDKVVNASTPETQTRSKLTRASVAVRDQRATTD